ncbi:MAG: hypothetical protein KDK39_08895 [Leptospiraceae bacterium]|nr:hypothetical protein [Leptospiraceae bacterium]
MQRRLRILTKEDPDEDRTYWQSKSPAERLAAVELLRRNYYACLGYTELPRLQKVITIRKRDAATL